MNIELPFTGKTWCITKTSKQKPLLKKIELQCQALQKALQARFNLCSLSLAKLCTSKNNYKEEKQFSVGAMFNLISLCIHLWFYTQILLTYTQKVLESSAVTGPFILHCQHE